MKIKTLTYTGLLVFAMLLLVSIKVMADNFTPTEKQQINVPTPGLFAKSKSFTADFTAMKESDYSFPLPVGKAKVAGRGLEIFTKKGDVVKAMFDGTVRLARNTQTHGNAIVIRHDNGLETVYGNNAQNLVKVGDRVKAGQNIAIAGSENEKSNTAKTIFEIMVNGCNINPQTLLKVNGHTLYQHIFMFTDKGNSVGVEIADGELYEPKEEEGTLDIDKELTAREQSTVSAQTQGLFDNNNSITINFANFKEGEWCYPLNDSHVISPYGGKRNHSGVDIKTKPNDEIHSVFDGKVRFAKWYGGYGNVIMVRHASGLETLYGHCSKILAKVGDVVKAGQVIALVGRTGRATTEHCHFEIRINGRAYNPALIFDHESHQLKPVKLTVNKSGKISVSPVK